MAGEVKVLALAGSARPGSYNRHLVAHAARGAAKAGADVTMLDLADLRLPLFDQNQQETEGFPDSAIRLKGLLNDHDAFLIASPEYNASISAPMKNAIDWASRPLPGESWKQCFVGKTAAIMCASTGGLGGLNGLAHLRQILSAMHVIVLPQQVTVAKAADAFDTTGTLRDAVLRDRTEELGVRLVGFAQKHLV